MDKLYTITELAEMLNMNRRSIQRYVAAGKIKAVMIGGKWKISETNLQEFLSEQKHNTPKQKPGAEPPQE